MKHFFYVKLHFVESRKGRGKVTKRQDKILETAFLEKYITSPPVNLPLHLVLAKSKAEGERFKVRDLKDLKVSTC